MNEIGSPLDIKLLLHCFVSAETYEPWSKSAEEGLAKLREVGAIEPVGDNFTKFRCTKLGQAWVNILCSTPPPRVAFLDAQGKEVQP